jgi:hypothetical protein
MLRSYEEKMLTFYLAGTIIFCIVAVASSVSLVMQWNNLILPSKVSSTFSNIFSYFLAWMFYEMYKNAKPLKITDENIEEMFNKNE